MAFIKCKTGIPGITKVPDNLKPFDTYQCSACGLTHHIRDCSLATELEYLSWQEEQEELMRLVDEL
jgi:hypothetical protein